MGLTTRTKVPRLTFEEIRRGEENLYHSRWKAPQPESEVYWQEEVVGEEGLHMCTQAKHPFLVIRWSKNKERVFRSNKSVSRGGMVNKQNSAS